MRGVGERLSEEQRQRMFSMLHKGASDCTIAAAVGCVAATVYHHRERLGLGTERRQHHGLDPRCVRPGCDNEPAAGAGTCAAHREMALPVIDNGFIRPPTLKQLMAGK